MIEVVSDVVCPWCYIGKRRLARALEILGRTDVEVRWRPFQLNPAAPKEGMDRAGYRARKFGPQSAELDERVTAVAREEQIEMRLDRIQRVPNTFLAHRLIWLAGREGVQDGVVEALFHSYFTEGLDVGDPTVLLSIAAQAGLAAPAVVQLLAGTEGLDEVTNDEATAKAQGVQGVPTFFVAGKPITSGAHPPQLLASMLGPAL